MESHEKDGERMDGSIVSNGLIIAVFTMAFFAMVIAVADLIRLLIERRDKRKYPCNKRWWEKRSGIDWEYDESRMNPFVGFSGDGEVVIYERKHLDELEEVL